MIWKHHKSSKVESDSKLILKEMKDTKAASESSNLALKEKRKAEYLIIGGGAAGFSAIQAIKEADPDSKVHSI